MGKRSNDPGSGLEANGLYILGHFSIPADEILLPDQSMQPATVALIGNVGSSIWPFFAAAREQQPDLTLDRWTKTTVGKIADQLGAKALYPFDGPPFWPFTQWAIRTSSLFPSPLGLTVHPVFGLWHAFRAALLFDENPGFEPSVLESPCTACEERPCLKTCPVGAFSNDGYDFDACLTYLSAGNSPCRSFGCAARKACPIGQNHHYSPDHAAFHMNQLLKAHGQG